MKRETVSKKSWASAYKAFLLDKNASLLLKLAPVALLFGYPEVVISNLLPVIGELIDVGAITVTVLVIIKTVSAVRKYRKI